jgi:RNA 2',3'-cyclic 3'-phosphodiesterase
VRLFFAAFPDTETRRRIASVAHALDLPPASSVVPHDNFHMTLAFVGERPQSSIATLRKIGAAQRNRAFSLRFDAYEYWPQAGVVVAAAREHPAALEQLWRELHATLAQHEPPLASQPLRPHVTLARKVSQAPVQQAMSAFDWAVRTFSLMQSNTSAARAVYTVVDTWPLLDEASLP